HTRNMENRVLVRVIGYRSKHGMLRQSEHHVASESYPIFANSVDHVRASGNKDRASISRSLINGSLNCCSIVSLGVAARSFVFHIDDKRRCGGGGTSESGTP